MSSFLGLEPAARSGRPEAVGWELPAGFAPLTEAAAAAAAVAAAAGEAAVFAGASFIDIERAAVDGGSVEAVDGAVGFIRVRHFDEGEAAGAARVTVGDDGDAFDGAVFFKPGADRCFGRSEIQVPNKNILQAFFFLI